MAEEAQNQVLGSGKLYFDRFGVGSLVGSGFKYFGNTPEFTLSNSTTSVDHYDSDNGPRIKDKSVDVSSDSTGSFSCDNINLPNLALFFLGEALKQTIVSATAVSETIKVKKGSAYQLGKTTAMPQGAMFVTNVVVKKGATTIAPLNNYDVDLQLGMIFIDPAAATIVDNDDLIITYDITAGTQDVVISKGLPAYGELKFISKNYEGRQKDYTAPYVKLSPNGDFSLKGEDWQTVTFSVELLKKASNIERLYVRDRGN